MIVFADLHLKEDTEKTVLEQVFPGLITAVVNDPDRVLVCLGDFFHVRYRIPVYLQNRVLDFLDALEQLNVRLLLLPGNHDQINFQGENALEVFAKFPNVTVFTHPAWNEYGYWVPYRKQLEDIDRALTEGMNTRVAGRPPVLWMHQGIKGAFMNTYVKDTTGLSVEEFEGWLVLCGHYHAQQQLGTITYIGSPYQITAGEAGQEKGYAIWNPVTLELRRVNTDWGKRYHNLVITNAEIDLTAIRPGDEVRAVTPPGIDPTVLGKMLEQLGAKVVVTPQLQVPGTRLTVAGNAGITAYAKEYVEQFAGSLDKKQLMTMYSSLSEEI